MSPRPAGFLASSSETRLEDVRFMAETGETATRAAQRLGLNPDALEAWCRDHDRNAWAQLMANGRPQGAGVRRGTITMALR